MKKILITKICPKCNKEFFVERIKLVSGIIKTKKHEKIYCSRSCANSHIQTKYQNDCRSKKLKNNIPWIKGKIFTYEEKLKYYGKRKRKTDPNKTNNIIFKKIKLYCKQCGKKLTRSDSKTMYCFTCIQKNTNSMRQYKHKCKFKFNVYIYSKEFDIQLLNIYGWYSAYNRGNNLNGISRDHMVSIKYGWEHNIPSEIISHPANCKLVLQKENSKKHTDCSITIEELYSRIKQWDIKYPSVANQQTR